MAPSVFACPSCGARLKAAAAPAAGATIKCPKCGKRFAVPAADAAGEPAAPPRPRKEPAPPPPDDTEKEESGQTEDRPRRRTFRKKRQAGPLGGSLSWGVIVVGAVVLVGGGITGLVLWWNWSNTRKPIEATSLATAAPAARAAPEAGRPSLPAGAAEASAREGAPAE